METRKTTEEIMLSVRSWYDGLPFQAKLASVLLVELLAKENNLPDKNIGHDIRNKLHDEVVGNGLGSEELGYLRGFYTGLHFISV